MNTNLILIKRQRYELVLMRIDSYEVALMEGILKPSFQIQTELLTLYKEREDIQKLNTAMYLTALVIAAVLLTNYFTSSIT